MPGVAGGSCWQLRGLEDAHTLRCKPSQQLLLQLIPAAVSSCRYNRGALADATLNSSHALQSGSFKQVECRTSDESTQWEATVRQTAAMRAFLPCKYPLAVVCL
jgi:hypothetical protein